MYRLFFVLACFTCHTYAAELVGKVIDIRGDVFIIDINQSKRNLFKGDFLYTQDQIQTSANSAVQFETNNNQNFTLYQNTIFSLNNYHYNPKAPELDLTSFQLNSGTISVNNSISMITNTNYIKTTFLNLESTYSDYLLESNQKSTVITVNKGSIRLLSDHINETITQGQTVEYSENNKLETTTRILTPTPNFDNKISIKEKKILKDSRPRLENFKNYKDFIQAMYLFKKAEEELKKPKIIIPNLPSGETLPEYSLIDDGYEVTNWAESLTNIDPNHSNDNIELVKHLSKMTIMTKNEMELSAVKDIWGVTFFSLADFLNMKVEELNRLISISQSTEENIEQQNSNDIMAKLLKNSIKTNAIGNDITILNTELGQPDITVIKRP